MMRCAVAGRREVAAIKQVDAKNPNSGFEVTVRHWEPLNYVEATKKSSSGSSSIVTAGAVGVAAGVALTKVVLPYLEKNHAHISSVQLLLEQPHIVHLAMIVLCTVFAFVLNSSFSSKGAHKSTFNIPAVGKGGSKVTVEEAKVGGSGSATVMRGETVEIETIRTRYVVNAAGGFSVRNSLVAVTIS